MGTRKINEMMKKNEVKSGDGHLKVRARRIYEVVEMKDTAYPIYVSWKRRMKISDSNEGEKMRLHLNAMFGKKIDTAHLIVLEKSKIA